ncbi:hypothetical protein FRC00_005523 [Tulasnella sp. 408]|nr:hypothetical protein FRC00_005523 [Tulasnella sp. 408]
MSSTSLRIGRRVLGSAASILLVVLLFISRITKSKAGAIICWLALLSVAPVIIISLLVELNARRSASIDLGGELPRPVVEVRRTRARATTASILRACRCLPTPSTQALNVMASRYINVFDATLGPGLVPHQVLSPIERPATDQQETVPGLPSLSSPCGDCIQARSPVTGPLSTSQAPLPGDPIPITCLLDPNTPTPSSYTTFSTVITRSEQTTSKVLFGATSDYVDNKASDPKAALIPNETRLSGFTLAASVNEKVSQTNLLERSRISFRSLPGLLEDNEPRATDSDSLVSSQGGMNVMGIVLSPLDTNRCAALRCTLPSIILTPSHQETSEVIFEATSGYVDENMSESAPASNLSDTRYSGVSRATSSMSGRMTQNHLFGISRHDIDAISVSFKRSRKVALNGGIMNPVGWSGKPLNEATTAIARGRATITHPQFIDSALSTPLPSSDGGTPASNLISSPAPTQSTAPTSIDLQQDERQTGTPSSITCSPLNSPNVVQAQDAKASVQEAAEGIVEGAVAWWRNGAQFKAVRSARHNRSGRRKSRYNALESATDEEWQWAKTEGKRPVGGRMPLVVTEPALPTTLVAPDTVDAEWAEGSADADDDLDVAELSKS